MARNLIDETAGIAAAAAIILGALWLIRSGKLEGLMGQMSSGASGEKPFIGPLLPPDWHPTDEQGDGGMGKAPVQADGSPLLPQDDDSSFARAVAAVKQLEDAKDTMGYDTAEYAGEDGDQRAYLKGNVAGEGKPWWEQALGAIGIRPAEDDAEAYQQ